MELTRLRAPFACSIAFSLFCERLGKSGQRSGVPRTCGPAPRNFSCSLVISGQPEQGSGHHACAMSMAVALPLALGPKLTGTRTLVERVLVALAVRTAAYAVSAGRLTGRMARKAPTAPCSLLLTTKSARTPSPRTENAQETTAKTALLLGLAADRVEVDARAGSLLALLLALATHCAGHVSPLSVQGRERARGLCAAACSAAYEHAVTHIPS